MASTDTHKPQSFNPANVPTPPTTYKHVSITPLLPTSKLITLAGQVGVDATTGDLPSGLLDQVRIAYRNLSNCLKAAGATPRDIVHVRHYVVTVTGDPEVDQQHIFDRGWGPLWEEFMDREGEGHRPPDTLLGVARLAKNELRYEVEAWAVVHS